MRNSNIEPTFHRQQTSNRFRLTPARGNSSLFSLYLIDYHSISISPHVCHSTSGIAQNFDSFGGINNSFWLWRRGIRLKKKCASSTATAARAGSSVFPKIQGGTEREVGEAGWEVGGLAVTRSSHLGSEHFIYSSDLSPPLLIQL